MRLIPGQHYEKAADDSIEGQLKALGKLSAQQEKKPQTVRKPIPASKLTFKEGLGHGNRTVNYTVYHGRKKIATAYTHIRHGLGPHIANMSMLSEYEGRGVGKALHDHIDADLEKKLGPGHKLLPDPSSITPRYHRFWQKRDPEAVKHYQQYEGSGEDSAYFLPWQHQSERMKAHGTHDIKPRDK